MKKFFLQQEALTTLKKKRDVWPSNAFLAFLAKLSNETHGHQHIEEVPLL
jgi:hypothetical protein